MRAVFSLCLTVGLFVSPLPAQEGYRLPPKAVVDIVDATPTPSVSLSPDGTWMLLIQGDALPPIADVSRRMLRLAGTRIDPAANSRFSTSFDSGLALRPTAGGDLVRIEIPDGARLAGTSWSHDSTHFVYTLVTDGGSELWGGSVDAPKETKRVTARLNTVLGGPQWMPDGASVLCRLVPNDHGDEPTAPTVPTGPNIQSTSGNASPLRTYQDLLSSPHDADVFDHYATTELWILPVESGNARHVTSGVISGASVSPDGQWILETTLKRPYSYLKPYYQFPQEYRARNLNTGEVKLIADVPSPENVPIEGVPLGPRSISWKSSAPATIAWVEALDGGDPKRKAEHRDAWFTQDAPFESEPVEILRTEHRARGLVWLEDPTKVIASEYDRDRRWTRATLRDLSKPDAEPGVIEDRSRNDRYGDPGRIVTERNRFGRSVPRQDGPWIYRSGSGASPEGSLPFLSRQNLVTLETEELWRSEKGSYESVVQVLTSSAEHPPTVVTRHETPLSPPNYLRRDLAQGSAARLTSFEDPTPEIRGIRKRLVTYERADGVPLSATLYLPADYRENTRLPLLVWAYPREFNDVKTAGQVSASPSRFTRIGGSSHLFLLTQGYAIMDGATMPIIGDPETMNDTFREQLVSSAEAAIRHATELGVADPTRVGVGGHSYGAFMTANLLAHCDLFKAGVARSGAYNRTLTPFGFQSERRTLWEAPEAYFGISPFMHAQKIDEPVLLIHGEADNNSGTFPMQSRRLFQAIKGNGGTARLVMLPAESHGYRARESILHVLAETIAWFDRHVKGPPTIEAGFTEDDK